MNAGRAIFKIEKKNKIQLVAYTKYTFNYFTKDSIIRRFCLKLTLTNGFRFTFFIFSCLHAAYATFGYDYKESDNLNTDITFYGTNAIVVL